MRWILLDVAIALAALAVLAVVLLRLWRGVKALLREVGRAGEAVAAATEALERAQAAGPLGQEPRAGASNSLDTRTAPAVRLSDTAARPGVVRSTSSP